MRSIILYVCVSNVSTLDTYIWFDDEMCVCAKTHVMIKRGDDALHGTRYCTEIVCFNARETHDNRWSLLRTVWVWFKPETRGCHITVATVDYAYSSATVRTV